jgi:hypothetical protein
MLSGNNSVYKNLSKTPIEAKLGADTVLEFENQHEVFKNNSFVSWISEYGVNNTDDIKKTLSDMKCDHRYVFYIDPEICFERDHAYSLIKQSVKRIMLKIGPHDDCKITTSLSKEDFVVEQCDQTSGIYFLSSRKTSIVIPVKSIQHYDVNYMIEFEDSYSGNKDIRCISSIMTNVIYESSISKDIGTSRIFFSPFASNGNLSKNKIFVSLSGMCGIGSVGDLSEGLGQDRCYKLHSMAISKNDKLEIPTGYLRIEPRNDDVKDPRTITEIPGDIDNRISLGIGFYIPFKFNKNVKYL